MITNKNLIIPERNSIDIENFLSLFKKELL